MDMSFSRGKRVLMTGHTGFKGSWLSQMLINQGALLTGYALAPDQELSLFELAGLERRMDSVIGDIRDFDALRALFLRVQPEIVLHLAAQPIVRESYKDPRYTYETNVMGTVNVLECARQSGCVRSFVNVTTDKVYENREWVWGYREDERLNGYDPYSNSKSCSELVTQSYRQSFFQSGAAISTARAGNVIGGGDFAADRIIPDCIRAALEGRPIVVRNPHSVRPYQHVLEPLSAYLAIAKAQWDDPKLSGAYNVGPEEADCVTTKTLVELFCAGWGEGVTWENRYDGGPHEANFLKLDCSKVKAVLGWTPKWNIQKAIDKTVEWTKAHRAGEEIIAVMDRQIGEYFGGSETDV